MTLIEASGDIDRDRRGCGGWKGQWESHFLKKVPLENHKEVPASEREAS